MNKVSAFVVIIAVLLIGLLVISNSDHLSSPSKEKKLTVSVTLLDEKQSEENKFKNVFKQERPFTYDEKTKSYKLCVGETSPMTESSSCHVRSGIVEVLHQINKEARNKPFYLCLYVSTDMKDCRIGDQSSQFYSKEEIGVK